MVSSLAARNAMRSSRTPASEHVPRPDQGAPWMQAALQRAKEHVAKLVQSLRLSPEAAKTAARLEVDGRELAGLKQVLMKAREVAQELPTDVQITQCEEFIERSEKRLAKMEAERIAETKLEVAHGCSVWNMQSLLLSETLPT